MYVVAGHTANLCMRNVTRATVTEARRRGLCLISFSATYDLLRLYTSALPTRCFRIGLNLIWPYYYISAKAGTDPKKSFWGAFGANEIFQGRPERRRVMLASTYNSAVTPRAEASLLAQQDIRPFLEIKEFVHLRTTPGVFPVKTQSVDRPRLCPPLVFIHRPRKGLNE